MTEFAPAKVNLCLHVTGRRPDGYHLLDSLAVFAGTGDTLSIAPAAGLTLTIDGPFGAELDIGRDNLVLRAARALGDGGAALHLSKHLPIASGIGGGSADAAATLRGLARLWNTPTDQLPTIALSLGADVPVCLASQPARMRGIGEQLDPVCLPPLGLVLVNPGVAVPTGPVFRILAQAGASFSGPLPMLPPVTNAAALAGWLVGHTRNDLQAPAISLVPAIATVLESLGALQDCLLARMSGSGATCFGLFADAAAATVAAKALARADWWCWGGQAAWQAGAALPPAFLS